MTGDRDIAAAIDALHAIRLLADTHATSEQFYAGAKIVLEALNPSGSTAGEDLRSGVTKAISAHFGMSR